MGVTLVNFEDGRLLWLCPIDIDGINDGEGRRIILQLPQEVLELLLGSFRFDAHSTFAVIVRVYVDESGWVRKTQIHIPVYYSRT